MDSWRSRRRLPASLLLAVGAVVAAFPTPAGAGCWWEPPWVWADGWPGESDANLVVPTNIVPTLTYMPECVTCLPNPSIVLRKVGGAEVAVTITTRGPDIRDAIQYVVTPVVPLAPHTAYEVLDAIADTGPGDPRTCAEGAVRVRSRFTTGPGPDIMPPVFAGPSVFERGLVSHTPCEVGDYDCTPSEERYSPWFLPIAFDDQPEPLQYEVRNAKTGDWVVFTQLELNLSTFVGCRAERVAAKGEWTGRYLTHSDLLDNIRLEVRAYDMAGHRSEPLLIDIHAQCGKVAKAAAAWGWAGDTSTSFASDLAMSCTKAVPTEACLP